MNPSHSYILTHFSIILYSNEVGGKVHSFGEKTA